MTFDISKYPGYTEMIFRNRKSTLTRKKPIATMETGDGLKVAMYDFYNKFHFFMKFDSFAPMVNVYSDNDYSAVQRDGAIADYSEKFGKITIMDIERIFTDTITRKQPATVSAEFIDFCQQYSKRKGMDLPEEEKPEEEKKPQVVAECHTIKYDSDGKMVYEPQEMESENVIQEEQNENAPLNISETSLAVEYEEDEAFANLPPETNLEELKPQPMTPEDEAVFEQASKSKEVEPNFKKTKKSAKAKKKSSKKSKK